MILSNIHFTSSRLYLGKGVGEEREMEEEEEGEEEDMHQRRCGVEEEQEQEMHNAQFRQCAKLCYRKELFLGSFF